jgi:cytochrome c biogenesis protein CcdA
MRLLATAIVLLPCLAFLAGGGTVAVAGSLPSIHVFFFDAPGCPTCAGVQRFVEEKIAPDPQVVLHRVDVHKPEGLELGEAILTVAGIGPDVLPAAPAILVGSTYRDKGGFDPQAVLEAIERARSTGTPDYTERAQRIRGLARQSLSAKYRRWGFLTVVGAGLLDGINPCAFATLVFFLSYLSFAGGGRRAMVTVGLLYAAGVYVAYFAFGLGLLHAVMSLEAFPLVRRVLYGVIGAACMVFAGVSVYDFRQLRAGNVGAVKLQLPTALKRQTHHAIRHGLRSPALAVGAFVAGALVSLLEFACTGQVYIPTLIYLSSLSETRRIAVAWLALYCGLFITPLLVLLGLAVGGVSSKRLAQAAQAQASRTKLLMALFFVLCAVFFLSRAIAL